MNGGAINGVYLPAKLGLSYAYPSRAIINLTICMNARVQHGAGRRVESGRRGIFRGIINSVRTRNYETAGQTSPEDKRQIMAPFVAHTFSYVIRF